MQVEIIPDGFTENTTFPICGFIIFFLVFPSIAIFYCSSHIQIIGLHRKTGYGIPVIGKMHGDPIEINRITI